jgi:AAA domain-containing protein
MPSASRGIPAAVTVPDRPGPPGGGLFVLVAGWPGSGKSTLAAALATRLGLPLLAKDEIKEALMDALGRPQTVADSQRLGRAAVLALLRVGRRLGHVGLEVGPALALLGDQIGHPRRVLLPLGVAVDHRVVEDGGGEQVRGELVGPRPWHLPGIEAARQGDGLGGPGEHRQPAGAVPLPEHDDMRPQLGFLRPVGPADFDYLCLNPVGSCPRRHGEHLHAHSAMCRSPG